MGQTNRPNLKTKNKAPRARAEKDPDSITMYDDDAYEFEKWREKKEGRRPAVGRDDKAYGGESSDFKKSQIRNLYGKGENTRDSKRYLKHGEKPDPRWGTMHQRGEWNMEDLYSKTTHLNPEGRRYKDKLSAETQNQYYKTPTPVKTKPLPTDVQKLYDEYKYEKVPESDADQFLYRTPEDSKMRQRGVQKEDFYDSKYTPKPVVYYDYKGRPIGNVDDLVERQMNPRKRKSKTK